MCTSSLIKPQINLIYGCYLYKPHYGLVLNTTSISLISVSIAAYEFDKHSLLFTCLPNPFYRCSTSCLHWRVPGFVKNKTLLVSDITSTESSGSWCSLRVDWIPAELRQFYLAVADCCIWPQVCIHSFHTDFSCPPQAPLVQRQPQRGVVGSSLWWVPV